MIRKALLVAAVGAVVCFVGPAMGDLVNFTAGEGFVDGAMLGTHSDWLAQNQWVNNNGAGDGVVETPVGDFIRGHYTPYVYDNGVGDVLTMSARFNLIDPVDTTSNVDAGWKEGIYTLDVTEQLASTAPGGRMEGGLYMNRATNELQLRAGGTTAAIGPAADYDGSIWDLTVTWTKQNATDYLVEASIDNGSGPWTASGTATPDALLSGAAAAHGFFKALPTAGFNYNGVQVDSFEVIPEPGTLGLLLISGLAMLIRRRR